MSGAQNIFASSVLIDDDGDPEVPVELVTHQLKANGTKREIYINGQDPLAGGGGGGDALLAGGSAQTPQLFTGFNTFNNNLTCGAEFISTVGVGGDSFLGQRSRLTEQSEIGTVGAPEIKLDGRATSNRPSGIQGDIEFSGALTGGVIGGSNEFRAQCDVPDGNNGFQCDVSFSGKCDALKELNSGTDVRAGVNGANETVKLEGSTGKITCSGDIELLTSGANIVGGATGQIQGGDFRVGVGGTSNKVSIQPFNEDANNENARIHLGQAVGSFSKLSIVKGKPNAQLVDGDTMVQFQQNDTMFPRTVVHPAFFNGGVGIAYNWTNNAYKLNTTVSPVISNASVIQNQTILTCSATRDVNTGLYTPVVGSSAFFDLYNDPPTGAGVGNTIFFPFTTRLDQGDGNIGTFAQNRFRFILRQTADSASIGGFLASSNVISLGNYPAPEMAGAKNSAGQIVGVRDSYYPLEYSTSFCEFEPNANTFGIHPMENSVVLARRSGYTTGTNTAFHQFFVVFSGFQNLPVGANVESMPLEIFIVAVQ